MAARHGARTILIESGGFFGGTAAAVLDTMYGFFPAGGDGRIVGGIAWEVANAMLESGNAVLRGNTYGAGTGVTYEPEALKVEWDKRILDSGVRPLLHSRMAAVILDVNDSVWRGGHHAPGAFPGARGPHCRCKW